MLPLLAPNFVAGPTFRLCNSTLRDGALRARCEEIVPLIQAASDAFALAAAGQRLHQTPTGNPCIGQVTTQQLTEAYTQRMVDGPGRGVYDSIFSICQVCPHCGHREVKTLDHFLPKAHYPLLSVVPLNLIPACSDCNKTKLAAVPRVAADVMLHPYFDNISEQSWLAAEVIERRPAALRFTVGAPDDWDVTLKARVLNQFTELGLGQLYAVQAAVEQTEMKHYLQTILDESGAQGVSDYLADIATSRESIRRNSWRAVAYRAWAESEWFCEGGFS